MGMMNTYDVCMQIAVKPHGVILMLLVDDL